MNKPSKLNLLIFPHQLFRNHPGLKRKPDRIILIEDSLFFGDWNYSLRFHKQKLWFHRSTMKRYEAWLNQKGFQTTYIDYSERKHSLYQTLVELQKDKKQRPDTIGVCDPTDFILSKRIRAACNDLNIELSIYPSQSFLNLPEENAEYRSGKKRWFMADFYKWQRRRLNLLMEGDEPLGGKWSFDGDNRKKVPKKLLGEIPEIPLPKQGEIEEQARLYVEDKFPQNPGSLEQLYYPTTHSAAKTWLLQFLKQRFKDFGAYEDAIVEGESWLWHSILTPTLNTGLLTPQQIIKETISFSHKHEVPLNSLEGFIRQVIGWREFMKATYDDLGVTMRTTNHWGHHRSIPSSFYDGTTGILPIDDTIQRILQTGYCHHIERLMVLGGFMFLCEFDPQEIYNWFMELFIDSYDWVMVPNVYAMSQHADGGLITTKPYFSGSAYVKKMSHYKKGPWCDTWDGLYWRWIWNHVEELAKNPRWSMMCAMAKKMDAEKRKRHLDNAEQFLDSL